MARLEAHLRILHLVRSEAYAGVERYLTYAAPALAARGHEVTVIGGDAEQMRRSLEPHGVRHIPARTVVEVARATGREPRPDVVHAHMTAAEAAAILAKPVVRRPIVTTLHFPARGRTAPRAVVYRSMRPFFAREIAISRFVAEHAGGKPVLLYNAVPTPTVVESATRREVVLVAQRLETDKDTETAIRAWAISGLARDGWRLEIAGSGSQRAALEELAHRLGSESSVSFVGFDDDLDRRRATSSVFLATGPRDSFGLSAVEAMASGLPVLLADGGAHPELVDGSSEQLYTRGDAASCAERLRALVHDQALRERLATVNRQRFEHAFTLDRHVDQLLEVYADVVRTRS